MNIKLLLIGPGGVGKTTLRKIFFDHANPMQLLRESLEPTYGIETTSYEFNHTVTIHDLAGQQLNEWFENPSEIYVGANLILLILDSQEKWEFNLNLIQKVKSIHEKYCESAIIGIFFHKIDLISQTFRTQLEHNIESIAFSGNTVFTFLTSIKPEFLLSTIKQFVDLFKKVLPSEIVVHPDEYVTHIDILMKFMNASAINLDEMTKLPPHSVKMWLERLQELQKKEIVDVNLEQNKVELTPKGKQLLNSLKLNLTRKVNQTIGLENPIIRGVIMAENFGRMFLSIENEPGFFNSIIVEGQQESGAELISMFFSSMAQFGTTFDPYGFSNVHITGKNIQIFHQIFESIFTLFFLEVRDFDLPMKNLLKMFTEEVYTTYKDSILEFLKKGSISNWDEFNHQVVALIHEYDKKLKTYLKEHEKLSKDQIYNLYQQILDKHEMTEIQMNQIKIVIFQFLISEELKDLTQIL